MGHIIPFNKPTYLGTELDLVKDLMENPEKHGSRYYSNECYKLLQKDFPSSELFLCHSASGALDLIAQLLQFEPGAEIIIPSFTFVSAATAFVNEGFTPVFADIDETTLSVSAETIAPLIGPKTKAIMMMHYGGRPCDVDGIVKLARENDLLLIEDAAHCIGVRHEDQFLGSYGDFGVLSFDSTKNITCGHGGLLLVNDKKHSVKAAELYEIGTNKKAFLNDEVPYYEWVNKGRKYALSELNAAFLVEQLKKKSEINSKRVELWNVYYDALSPLQKNGVLKLADRIGDKDHNAHTFYLLLNSENQREALRKFLKKEHIQAVSHFVPLHESRMGSIFYAGQNCKNTADLSRRLLRLPLFYKMSFEEVKFVVENVKRFFE